jgi:small-conductance mechanosensitive channel
VNSQERRSLTKSVISILIAVIIVYSFEYFYLTIANFLNIPGKYDIYVKDAFVALIIIIVAFVLLRITRKLLNQLTLRSNGERNLNGIYIILRILIYALAITVFLIYAGVNLEGALVGGAIGGVVIGFAVQSVVSSLLSGLLVTAGGFLKPDESISIFSWMFPETLTGKVEDVKTLYTRVKLTNSRSVLIPNTILFGSSIFTKLNEGRKVKYEFNSVIPADVNAREVIANFTQKKEKLMADLKIDEINSYFIQKNGTTNTISFIIQFEEIVNLNGYMDRINTEVEDSYWEIKNKPKN